ncbi:MAG: hypothetical protein CMO55_25405 [Verrucomicrobiales bacterium]|nr:hypothetical protein [Verrucomicrobiales bacterium]
MGGITTELIAAIGGAFLLTFAVLICLCRFWKFSTGVDHPDGVRKHQEAPVIRVGGIALYIAFLAGWLISSFFTGEADSELAGIPFLILGTLIFLLGFTDDLFGLSGAIKLAVQIAIGVAAYLAGMRIGIISNPIGEGSIDVGGFSLIVTVLWFVAIPNLVNLVDGLDGLAGGVVLFLSATLAVLGGMTGDLALLLFGASIAAGVVAFLCFNLPPARVYMGDGGAYLLGYFIAGSSLVTSNKGSMFGALLVVVIALGFPILDTLFAMCRRAISGLPIMAPDARHIHHRLMTLGFSKRTILLVLYGVFAGLCLLGLSVFVTSGYTLPVVGMVVTVGVFLGFRSIGLPHSVRQVREALGDIVAARKDIRYAYNLSQVLEHDIERSASAEEYWGRVRESLLRLDISPASKAPNSEPCGEGRCLIVFPLRNERVWKLCCPEPKEKTTRRQWDRVIRCFLPALMNGLSRWESLPEDLGIEELPKEQCPELLEEQLNRKIDMNPCGFTHG